MGFFRELFSRPVTSRDLRVKLHEVERDRRRTTLELRKLGNRQADLIERIKKLRREGNHIEVDYLWEELKGLKVEIGVLKRDARVRNLEGISLKRYIRGLEKLERSGDKDSVRRLIERVRSSGLDSKLVSSQLDDREYLDELSAVLEDAGLDAELLDEFDRDDEKDSFLAQIDEINAAEEAGDLDVAFEKESTLRTKLEEGEGRQSEKQH